MINPEHQKVLQDLSRMPHGKVLRDYLTDKKNEISNIKTVKTWEETQGRKLALDLIDELFSFMEEKETSVKSKTLYS